MIKAIIVIVVVSKLFNIDISFVYLFSIKAKITIEIRKIVSSL